MKSILPSVMIFFGLSLPLHASASITDFANSDEAMLPAALASKDTGCPTLTRENMVTLAKQGTVTLDGAAWSVASGSENNAKILANLIEGNVKIAMDEVFHCKKAVKSEAGCTYEMCLNAHPAYDDMHYTVTITKK